MRGRAVVASWGVEGICCAKEIEESRRSEKRRHETQQIRMRVPHCGISGGEPESALSLSQDWGSGKGVVRERAKGNSCHMARSGPKLPG